MRGQTVTTFISPLSFETVVTGGKRKSTPHFYLLQPGADPLKLEYASKVEARAGRKQLLQSSGAHSIVSMKLFWAIRDAMAALTNSED